MGMSRDGKVLVVTFTTINPCINLLESYVDNFSSFGHWDVGFIIVGDVKTPPLHRATEKVREKGFNCEYLDIEAQKTWLKKYPDINRYIPFNSDNRRNIGYLRAAELSYDIIVSIDDDNYALPEEDFYGHHRVGTVQTMKSVESPNKWFNPCSLLAFDQAKPYMRGYPLSKRFNDEYTFSQDRGTVVLNMGLWLGDPDVDAFTNLTQPCKSTGYKEEGQIMVKPRVYTPINSQNTAFHRSILPCYYFVLTDLTMHGLNLGRYGDIWQGFFAKKVIDAVGDRVTIGHPLTMHKRNKHDLVDDLKKELLGITINERLSTWLGNLEINSKTYFDAYLEISEALNRDRQLFGGKVIRKYLGKVSEAMYVWLDTCEEILEV